jgi:hypothetical protein
MKFEHSWDESAKWFVGALKSKELDAKIELTIRAEGRNDIETLQTAKARLLHLLAHLDRYCADISTEHLKYLDSEYPGGASAFRENLGISDYYYIDENSVELTFIELTDFFPGHEFAVIIGADDVTKSVHFNG